MNEKKLLDSRGVPIEPKQKLVPQINSWMTKGFILFSGIVLAIAVLLGNLNSIKQFFSPKPFRVPAKIFIENFRFDSSSNSLVHLHIVLHNKGEEAAAFKSVELEIEKTWKIKSFATGMSKIEVTGVTEIEFTSLNRMKSEIDWALSSGGIEAMDIVISPCYECPDRDEKLIVLGKLKFIYGSENNKVYTGKFLMLEPGLDIFDPKIVNARPTQEKEDWFQVISRSNKEVFIELLDYPSVPKSNNLEEFENIFR